MVCLQPHLGHCKGTLYISTTPAGCCVQTPTCGRDAPFPRVTCVPMTHVSELKQLGLLEAPSMGGCDMVVPLELGWACPVPASTAEGEGSSCKDIGGDRKLCHRSGAGSPGSEPGLEPKVQFWLVSSSQSL